MINPGPEVSGSKTPARLSVIPGPDHTPPPGDPFKLKGVALWHTVVSLVVTFGLLTTMVMLALAVLPVPLSTTFTV